MTTLVFLLEEPSAREMLKGILPRILPKTVVPEYKYLRASRIWKNGWNGFCGSGTNRIACLSSCVTRIPAIVVA